MQISKIIRTVCLFTNNPTQESVTNLNQIEQLLRNHNFEVQTKRLCTSSKNISELNTKIKDNLLLSVGNLTYEEIVKQLDQFFLAKDTSCNLDLSDGLIEEKHLKLLFDIISNKPSKTFNFSFVFNNALSSPYFPSASYERDGFALGLQPTDLSQGCKTLEEWFANMEIVWTEIQDIFKEHEQFLGIDPFPI